ncbi:MAG: sigma-54-dependent Fis family transcriptional regulator [Deltaproteobacteria bacterium]|nr:sigma-54-dependent Fis family transcriptional regulator [Deltaproteobacteria bacterium]
MSKETASLPSVLIVDDEPMMRQSTQLVLQRHGFEVTTADSGRAGRESIDRLRPEVVLLDVKLPDMDGIDLLKEIKTLSPESEVIVMTGYGTVESAVDAMKSGAFHYITKPFQLDDLLNLLAKAREHHALRQENLELKRQLQTLSGFENFIGSSEKMQKIFSLIRRVADTDSTVLITGESGTGKELVARALHNLSRRRDKLLVAVNCGAIPEDLLESELFGHTRGSFTGAIANRTGRFVSAHGGTLFLDEVGEMSPNLQVKLLRVLQEKEVTPIGSEKTLKVDVRVIAATNQDLSKLIREDRFREDLYYRLNVIPIQIPPLRERRDDIPLLAKYFIDRFVREKNMPIRGITSGAMAALTDYSWPGNVRELENLMERTVVLKGEGVIDLADLPEKLFGGEAAVVRSPAMALPQGGLDLKRTIEDFEDRLILSALDRTGWNKNRAAALLRIKRTTLIEKLKKRGIHPPPGAGTDHDSGELEH